jgi:DNA gyrase/topoisomerase IV subunit A
MKWLFSRLLIFTACTACVGAAAEGTPSLLETRSTLEQWVQTRQLISKTRSDWDADKETLGQTVALYERELKSLADQRANVSTNHVQVEKERLAATAQQAELEAAVATTRTLVIALEKRLQELAPTFPPPLADKLSAALKRIPADSENTKMPALERMQNLVGILNEADKFNAAITVVSEVQKNPSGAEVQVETLYLGLAQAFFVDKAGEYAGTGTPAATGWQWTPNNQLASRIQKSIAMYKNATPADFVNLPVQIK